VAAIAHDQAANVVDGNVERVMARLFAVESPLPAAKSELAHLAAQFVRDQRPGDWAQALMDLGATVCRPRGPLCDACPLAGDCQARAGGAPETYPRRVAKATRPHRHGAAFVLTRGDQVALARRPPKGLLGGMLGLPTTPWRAAAWTLAEAMDHAPRPGPWRDLGVVNHVFTHFSLDLRVLGALDGGDMVPLIWTPRALAVVSLPSLFRRALELTAD
jgi:A/G-specific adenine glycosylase